MTIYVPRIACFLILVFIQVFCFAAKGHAVHISQTELEFVHLVNQVRTDPLPAVDEMGWSTDNLADSGLLLGGMEPLELDDRLTQAAQEQSQEILNLNYYSHVSPDGVTPAQRLVDKGYHVFDSDQSLAILTFRNFMSSREAISSILGNLLTDEASSQKNRKLFNPVFRDIGVCMQSGEMDFGERMYSVYLLVVNVAVSKEYAVESALHQLINDLRQNPDYAYQSSMFSSAEREKSNDPYSSYLYPNNKLLAINAQLDRLAAIEHDKSVLSPVLTLADQETIENDVKSLIAAYDPQFLSITEAKIQVDEKSSVWHKAGKLLDVLLHQETENIDGPQHVLLADLSEIGMHVAFESVKDADYAMLTLVAARPHKERSHVLGGVYAWSYQEDNKQVIEGVGVAGMGVEIQRTENNNIVSRTWTDVLGRYQLPYKGAAYRLNLRERNGKILNTRSQEAQEENRMVQFWTPVDNSEVDGMLFSDQTFIW